MKRKLCWIIIIPIGSGLIAGLFSLLGAILLDDSSLLAIGIILTVGISVLLLSIKPTHSWRVFFSDEVEVK